MIQRSRQPGPSRTSCLTCRRRHKKCDQRQPTCERCETGDFECLGYGHIQDTPPVIQSNRRLLPKGSGSKGPYPNCAPSGFRGGESAPNYSLFQTGRSEDTVSASYSLKLSTLSGLSTPNKVSTPGPAASHMEGRQPYHLLSLQSALVAGASTSTLQRIVDLYTRSYCIPDPLKALDGQWLIDTIMARAEKSMGRWYFKPIDFQERFRQVAIPRLRKSKFTCWITLLGTSILESFLAGDVSQSQLHNTWIEHIENSLKYELTLDLAPHEIRDRRGAWVHVSLMKTKLIHSSNTYQLLRRITPAFLQVAYSNPALWSSDCDLTRVPLMNILTSDSHELAMFTLIDCTYAMAFGVPQQIEYDTTLYPRPDSSSSHQWAHGSPMEFHLVLADINACRDQSPTARDWRDIEHWLLMWEQRPGNHAFTESWMTVAWYAVQESWRLAFLVYLYLAVCGASSDDPRIQSYIKQIIQVIGTVKKRGPSNVTVSLFSQYLLVGICARSEGHRKIARDKLSSANETKFWLMPASDFVPVLDHLWHGAGAGGRPVKWSDYVHSREAVLPVAL